MPIGMEAHLNVNAFEILSARQPVPSPHGLANGLLCPRSLLYAIMPYMPAYGPISRVKFVVPSHRHEWTGCYTIRSLKDDGARAPTPQVVLDGIGNIVEEVLGSAALPASGFGLLEMHHPPPSAV
jgi:hypothetical protein